MGTRKRQSNLRVIGAHGSMSLCAKIVRHVLTSRTYEQSVRSGCRGGEAKHVAGSLCGVSFIYRSDRGNVYRPAASLRVNGYGHGSFVVLVKV